MKARQAAFALILLAYSGLAFGQQGREASGEHAKAGDPSRAAIGHRSPGLRLEKAGTDRVYFSYRGRPLLSFGGLSDFIFYAAEDAYDYELWADWAAEHGINHVRAYPPLSWIYVEEFAEENGGSQANVLFPYEETQPGSRQFDLTRFHDPYWRRVRRQLEYLESKGIVVHLLMWNGWQLRAADTRSDEQADRNWSGHFFNPANNVNTFTDHLGGNLENRFRIYHSVAGRNGELVDAQKAWFRKLVEVSADLDNLYYDLVHELKEHHRDWSKTQPWIETMAKTVRARSRELNPDKMVILGMDTGGLATPQREWVFSRPYFDLLIYGKAHKVDNARNWRTEFHKPYVPQESWDDNGQKYSYIHPQQRVHTRKYLWKFMMAKCQQLDVYMKPRRDLPSANLPKHPHNYDPRARNKLEDDAVVLRRFWDRLTHYPNLWFQGRVVSGPGSHQYVLSSKREAIVYLSSATGKEGVRLEAGPVRLAELALSDGAYAADLVKPDRGVVATEQATVSGGKATITLPEFTDDIAVHLHAGEGRSASPGGLRQPAGCAPSPAGSF